jgi:hypothetical protein
MKALLVGYDFGELHKKSKLPKMEINHLACSSIWGATDFIIEISAVVAQILGIKVLQPNYYNIS